MMTLRLGHKIIYQVLCSAEVQGFLTWIYNESNNLKILLYPNLSAILWYSSPVKAEHP